MTHDPTVDSSLIIPSDPSLQSSDDATDEPMKGKTV